MNWKKYAIYDFVEFCKDIKKLDNMLQVIELKDIDECINDYIVACHYDYENNKKHEDFTLEELEEFLKSVFI